MAGMNRIKDEFLSEEDLDLRNLAMEELKAYWNFWLRQAQATNDLDKNIYSHGVFMSNHLISTMPKTRKR